MSNEIITLWYECKFGAVLLQGAVKSVAVSDICFASVQ